MSENVITIRITVRCHAVAHLMQFFYCLTFVNASQISAQTQIHIRLFAAHCFIECPFFCFRLIALNRCRIDQVNLFIFSTLHPAEDSRRIQRILRLRYQTVFNPSKSSFNGILPFFIRNIKEITEYLHMDCSPVLAAQFTLKLSSGTL